MRSLYYNLPSYIYICIYNIYIYIIYIYISCGTLCRCLHICIIVCLRLFTHIHIERGKYLHVYHVLYIYVSLFVCTQSISTHGFVCQSHSYILILVHKLSIRYNSKVIYNIKLVGGVNPSEKYEFVSWYDYSPIYGKS